MKRYRKARSAARANAPRGGADEPADSDIPTAELVDEPPVEANVPLQDLARRTASLQARLVLVENELKRARKDALDANARASALARQLAELGPAVKRLAALEADLAALGKRVEETTGRNREEIRRSLDAQRRVIFAELDAFRNTTGPAGNEHPELVSTLKTVLEQLDQTAAREVETERRIKALEKTTPVPAPEEPKAEAAAGEPETKDPGPAS